MSAFKTQDAIEHLIAPRAIQDQITITIKIDRDTAELLRSIAYATSTKRGTIAQTLLQSAIADMYTECESMYGHAIMNQCTIDSRHYANTRECAQKRSLHCNECNKYTNPANAYCEHCYADLHFDRSPIRAD